MATLKIVTYPDPVLQRKAKSVLKVTRRIRSLIDDMLETMYAAPGVGLAAPQVGIRKRVIVVDVGEGPITLVNPELIVEEDEQLGIEGCLSLPDLVGEVCRAKRVVVKGRDRRGRPTTVQGEDFLARALQHEIDHLNGILFIARVEDPTRIWKVSELEAMAEEEMVHI
jgi:peptide deformylase